jgi:adenine-specific DNA-methyltransferase
MLTGEMLTQLSDEVGPHRSLLICCSAFRGDASAFENLTVKKIPKAVLNKCEWGHDDYSLEIRNLPAATTTGNRQDASEEQKKTENRQDAKVAKEQEMKGFPRRFGKGKAKDTGPTLFDEEEI